MKFNTLRLVGFKSFVEPTDLEIRDGLTGVVGPNGCGKSNLLEALRWVMGATSAKALRGDGMGDVIFSGTSMRPSRNWAEVVLTLDNADRSAPGEFNDSDVIEVSRRIIHKDEGTQSIYRINAKEVRAKDVQLLFADASTGANSPALVRQGQIAELISAKPQNRRRLLEEAAGITGLHTRRHEAELRLRAAEQNLSRLDDVIGELENQKVALARQARQATRYRNLSGDIRRAEAAAAYLRYREAVEAREAAAASLAEASRLIEETALAAAASATRRGAAHEALDPLRLAEAEAAAALHRLTVAREQLDAESARANAEIRRLGAEAERLAADHARESALRQDAEDAVDALTRESAGLAEREAAEAGRIEAASARHEKAGAAVETIAAVFEEKSAEAAALDARRRAAAAAMDAADRRIERAAAQIAALAEERRRIEPTPQQAESLAAAARRFENADEGARAAEAALHRAEEERAAAEAREAGLKGPRQKAEQSRAEARAEADGLRRALGAHAQGDYPALIEAIDAAPGYENAIAAALGDDLFAATDAGAPAHWGAHGDIDAAPLPGGAEPLAAFARAPQFLALRLSMIGVVDSAAGEALSKRLKPGQRLVSRAGDLWRWDGFVARAEAKTAAAIRLEQRNRLALLEKDVAAADERARASIEAHAAAAADLAERQRFEREARALFADARRARDEARTRHADLERENERATARLSAIADALAAAEREKAENETERAAAREERSALPDAAAVAEGVAAAREAAGRARAEASEARAAFNDLTREAAMRARRIDEINRERGVWGARGQTAAARTEEIAARLADVRLSLGAAEQAPALIDRKRGGLMDEMDSAAARRRAAGDALAAALSAAAEADRAARIADAAASEARETRARIEAQHEAAMQRVDEATMLARESCSAAPDELPAIAEFRDGAELPLRADVDARLERYRRERENLGGVNLRADEEMQDVTARLDELVVEREDCDGAIRKLRASIGALNREARDRLTTAFETVNRNFSSLFTRLFNGGQAELRLIESEDVLEAGLEIYASPPGKKLASMSLMSGGEQALTATALIFAVFMANPAPVCVLDEVDAPLDDANVERFCRLLHEMAQETKTRFLIITHHALTMSRMNRLYGVTMVERGVSQLVSVDLNKAEQLVAAE